MISGVVGCGSVAFMLLVAVNACECAWLSTWDAWGIARPEDAWPPKTERGT